MAQDFPVEYMLLWEKAAREADVKSLDNVRSAAQSWASSIGGLTGAFGILAILKGPDTLNSLVSPWSTVVPLFLFVALVLALIGTFLAAFAAQGFPKAGWADPLNYRRFVISEAETAARRLRCSRWFVVVAVVALLVALICAWLPQDKGAIPADFLILLRSGHVECGQLFTHAGTISLQLKPHSRESVLSNVVYLHAVNHCP